MTLFCLCRTSLVSWIRDTFAKNEDVQYKLMHCFSGLNILCESRELVGVQNFIKTADTSLWKKNGRGGVTKSEKTVEVLYGSSYTTYTYLCTCFPSQFYLYFSTRIDSFFYHECTCILYRGCHNRFLASKTDIVAATSPACHFLFLKIQARQWSCQSNLLWGPWMHH